MSARTRSAGTARTARTVRAALAAARARLRDDRGFTLTEMLVSMTIMTIVMAMVTAGVVQASSTSARVQAASVAQSQIHQAFDRLDRQVRWASGISTPGTVGGNPYVEFLYTYTATPTCYELRVNRVNSQLQERSWPQGAASAGPWQPLASWVSGTTPFTVTAAGSAYAFSRLRVTVTASQGSTGGPGGAGTSSTSTNDVTFTALNSGTGSSTSSVCTEGRSFP